MDSHSAVNSRIQDSALDKNRIQGFGSSGDKAKRWTCDKAHMLQPWTAQKGVCDGCGAVVRTGERVMDCRVCNFYLCEDCHPQEQSGMDAYLSWINSAINVVTEEFTEISHEVNDAIEAAASVMNCGAPPKTEQEHSELEVPQASTSQAEEDEEEEVAAPAEREEGEVEGEEQPPAEEVAEPAAADDDSAPKVPRMLSDLMEMEKDDLITFEEEKKATDAPDIHQEMMIAFEAAAARPADAAVPDEGWAAFEDAAGGGAAAPPAQGSAPKQASASDLPDLFAEGL